jgi:carbon-monoxide dehydrogenase iron sulfur subunit
LKKVYVKEEFCMGCRLCEVYCAFKYTQARGLIKAYRCQVPRPKPRLRLEEKGHISFSVRCQHCDQAACAYACPTGALACSADAGLIAVDEEKCIGCWTCILACPFGAIKQDVKRKKILKCDLCQKEDVPVCVASCPNEALVYVDIPEK